MIAHSTRRVPRIFHSRYPIPRSLSRTSIAVPSPAFQIRQLGSTVTATDSPPTPLAPKLLAALRYTYAADTIAELHERRAPFRTAHLQHASSAKKMGHLLQGGAFSDAPPGEGTGALLIFSSLDAANSFAATDPYVVNKLVKGWSVREWTVVI